jgi:hypothetical protein
MKRNDTGRTVGELFSINVFIIALDIGLLVVEYMDLSVYEQSFKAVIYSIKLKLEFAILGKLDASPRQLVRRQARICRYDGLSPKVEHQPWRSILHWRKRLRRYSVAPYGGEVL